MRLSISYLLRSNLVLETLEDQLSLLILVLSDAILRLQLIQLHCFRVLEIVVFRVEHMGTKVQHCSLVYLCSLVLGGVYLGIILHKLTYPLHEVALLH